MINHQDSFQYDIEFLEQVFSFLNNYEQLKIDLNNLYQLSTKEKQVLEKMKILYSKIKLLKDAKTVKSQCVPVEDSLLIANDNLINLFPSKKKQIIELDNLIKFDDITIYDAGLIYLLNNNKIEFNSILIPNTGSNYLISVLVHEKVHALTFNNMDLISLFQTGLELLPILLQKIVLYEVADGITNTFNSIIRINDTKECFYHLDFSKYLKNNPNYTQLDQKVSDYFRIRAFDYLISELYSDLLLKYYQVDRNMMIERLNKVLANKITLPEFLNSYHISLLNKDLIPIIKEETNKCKRMIIIP